MKALVLTYDKYRPLTDHMIHMYRKLWPDNPFNFRIPYQELAGNNEHNREYISCPADIKGTVLCLLSDLDDDEWVYWCIDDKYPVQLDVPGIRSIMEWIRAVDDTSVSGVLCCRPGKLMKQKRLTNEVMQLQNGTRLLGRINYKSIWIHQFLQVKVLRHLFKSFPDVIPDAKTMDHLKNWIEKPTDQRLFVTDHSLAIYGESTLRGVLTQNCYQSLLDSGLTIPKWHTGEIERECILGNPPERVRTPWRRLFSNRS